MKYTHHKWSVQKFKKINYLWLHIVIMVKKVVIENNLVEKSLGFFITTFSIDISIHAFRYLFNLILYFACEFVILNLHVFFIKSYQ